MGDDRPPDEAGFAIPPELPPTPRRLLAGYSERVEQVRVAEAGYRDATASAAASTTARSRRVAQITAAEAFERLADAVVGLQESWAAVRSQAQAEGLPSELMLTLEQALTTAGRQCAGYLAARTYEQVREVAGRRPPLA